MDEHDSPAHDVRRRVGRKLPDIICGANDAILTTFAVVSGAVGGSLSSQVVLLVGAAVAGIAYSIGDSMARIVGSGVFAGV